MLYPKAQCLYIHTWYVLILSGIEKKHTLTWIEEQWWLLPVAPKTPQGAQKHMSLRQLWKVEQICSCRCTTNQGDPHHILSGFLQVEDEADGSLNSLGMVTAGGIVFCDFTGSQVLHIRFGLANSAVSAVWRKMGWWHVRNGNSPSIMVGLLSAQLL